MVAVVILSVLVWGVVAAQDATAEPSPAATAEAYGDNRTVMSAQQKQRPQT